MGPVPPGIPCSHRDTRLPPGESLRPYCSYVGEDSPTYGLSLGSTGAVGPRHASVALLTLLSRGSNQTDETWVSFLSFAAGISAQTRQTGRSLEEEEQRKGGSEEDNSPRRSCK